jgi:hypothetical protein
VSMPSERAVGDLACCGLVCGRVCIHGLNGCAGCRAGGGAESCHKRQCCQSKGFDGCWQCDDFACAEGFLADEAWRGLTAGCVQLVRELGAAAFCQAAAARLGEGYDYGYLRYRTPEHIVAVLRGEAAIPQQDPEDE